MKISVVTVAFNSGRTIRHTIESFLAQTHREAELLVIDGASTDDTCAIVRSYADPRIRLLSEPDRGLYDAMNKGLGLFGGDAVGFLNSDDRYNNPGVLGAIAAALAQHDVVCGNLDFVEDHVSRRVVRRWRGRPWRPGGFRRGWMPAHPTFYVRRAVAARTGAFDLGYRIAADYDFMLRAVEFGGGDRPVRAAFIADVMVDMMIGGASTSGLGAYLRGNLESLRSRRRWLGSGLIDTALLAKPFGKLGQFVAR
ncbi:MAG: glycosyltransferase family 2 protein [Thermohalobaculum sp.]|nr:glycosyltransferase family 2 protein [Thermohalobaculum sp.]